MTGASRPDDVVLDARWLGKGGAGTFTALLLEGLSMLRPPGWTVWGDRSLRDRLWPGAGFVACDHDPATAFGQRSVLAVPPASLMVHPHQTRPWHRRPAASCVLDLIQLDLHRPPVRLLMAARLHQTVRAADVLFTISTEVRSKLVARYGIDPEEITVLQLPAGRAPAERIEHLRRGSHVERRYVVTVGRLAAHKNHRRLLAGFTASRFAASGGELHLVGVEADQLDDAGIDVSPGVVVRGVLDPDALEAELAGATGMVFPSLQEGHGLPVTEALLAGLPVASSPVPAAVEFGPDGLTTFDPTRAASISAAIDEMVELVESGRYWDVVDRRGWLAGLPTATTLVRQMLDRLERHASASVRRPVNPRPTLPGPAAGRASYGRVLP